MRLDDFDPNINVEDQRGQGGSGFGGFGGGGGGGGLLFAFLPFIFNRFGCLGVAVVVGLFFLFSGGLQFADTGGSGGSYAPTTATRSASGTDAKSSCTVDASSKVACNAFSSADKTWAAIFQQKGQRFVAPKLVFYSGNGQSGCGAVSSMGIGAGTGASPSIQKESRTLPNWSLPFRPRGTLASAGRRMPSRRTLLRSVSEWIHHCLPSQENSACRPETERSAR